jgi:hypothetical protein
MAADTSQRMLRCSDEEKRAAPVVSYVLGFRFLDRDDDDDEDDDVDDVEGNDCVLFSR